MPGATSFRQTEEKQSSFVIDLMLWSPKMDLIAVTAITGEVFVITMFMSFCFMAVWISKLECESNLAAHRVRFHYRFQQKEGLRERTEHLDIILFFRPSFIGVLFPMFCLLVEGSVRF